MASLSIDVSVNSTAAIRELRELNNNLNAIRSSEQNLNTTSNTTFNNMNNCVTKVNGNVKLLGATFSGFKSVLTGILGANLLRRFASGASSIFSKATENASTLYEYSNVLEQVFKKQAKLADEWIKLDSKNYGLSIVTSTKYLSEYAALLDTIGVKNKEVLLDMSQNYTKLAGDIASFYNESSDKAFSAITSGITGSSTRPLYQYGLVLKSTNLEQYLATKGIDATWKSLTELEKEYVRYAYILDSTRNIQGDYARTSDSYANSLHTLQENWKNLLGVLGSYGITIIKPVVQWLAVAIKYVEYFSKKLFELFGIEPTEYEFGQSVQDMSLDFGDSADSTDEILDNTIDTGKQIAKNNKALKQGTKLLDLYYIDFPKADEDTGVSTPDISTPNIDTNLYDKLKDSFWYNDFPLEDIKIDTTAVDRIIKFISDIKTNLSAFIDWLRYDLGFEEALKFALANPADVIENVFATIFGVAVLNRLWKKYGAVFFSMLAAKIFKAGEGAYFLEAGKGILGGIIAGIAAAVGGYNLGEVITQLFAGAEVDIADATIGLVATIGSIIYMGVQTGPIGAAFAAIIAAATFVIGSIQEAEQQGTALAQNTLDMTSDMLSSYQPVLDGLFDAEAFSQSQSRLAELKDSFANTTNDLVNVQIPKLQEALYNADGQANLDVLSDLQQAYKDLAKAAGEYKTENFKEEIQTSFDMFSAGAQQIGTATGSVTEYIQEYSKWHEEFVKSLSDEYAYLETQAATGILTDEQQARLTSLREYFGTEVNEFDKYTKSLPSLDDIELFSPESIDKTKERIEGLRSMAETQYSQARATAESDLQQALATGDAEALQNVSEYITTLEASYGGFVEEYNKIIERFNTQAKESATNLILTDVTNLTVQEGQLDDIINAVLGTPDAWNNLLTKYGDSIAWDSLPADFRARMLKSARESQISTDQAKELGQAIYGMFIDGVKQGLSEYTITDSDFVSFDLGSWISDEGFYDWLESVGIPNRLKTTLDTSLKTLVDNLAKSDVFDADYTTGRVLSVTLAGVKPLVKPDSIDTSEAKKVIEGQTTSSVSAALQNISVETDAKDLGDRTADSVKTGLEEDLESQATKEELTNAANIMVSGISSDAEAKEKGSAFGKSIISGLATALGNVDSDTEYVDAKTKFINSLLSIPDKFLTAFKATLRSIGSEIETFGIALGSGLDSTFTSDLTVSQLATKLKSGGLKVPYLANGAVIPPNNPFLAVLGDQRSGTNIEAPVSVIRQAVSDATGQQDITVNTTVYLGNTELRDYIVDTVIDSNLVSG